MKRLLEMLAVPVSLAAFAALLYLEKHRPLRDPVESKIIHDSRNLAVAAVAGIVLQLCERPLTVPLTKLIERKKIGLLKLVRLPKLIETIGAVVLMDYTLYLWHVLTHKVPFLWRFHLVHHVDLEMDASTALRFHFGELLISVAWRAAQILLIGVSPVSLAAWQLLLFPEILFHHSNVELSPDFEKKLARLIVTPRLHAIHHSAVRNETDSNWSSGLTVWDRLHGTLKTDVEQAQIVIGVPAYRQPNEVTLTKIMPLPFEKQREDWRGIETRKSANQLR